MLSAPLAASRPDAEATAWLGRAVVREEEVGIRTLERDDLERRVRLDLAHEVVEGVVHPIVDHIDRRVVQRDAPMTWRRLVDDEFLLGFAHLSESSSVLVDCWAAARSPKV